MTDKSIWDLACETDPHSTKPVSFGARKFTAIDAYSQIHKATELFGSIGTGWGYSVEWDYSIPNVVCADMLFWYTKDKVKGEFQVSGACDLAGKPKVDSEAKKKALTDGITKALSYLGFNADVFLGKFDDNKYVAEMNAKFSKAHAKRVAGNIADEVFKLVNDNDEMGLWQIISECTDEQKLAIKTLLPDEEHHIKRMLQNAKDNMKKGELQNVT